MAKVPKLPKQPSVTGMMSNAPQGGPGPIPAAPAAPQAPQPSAPQPQPPAQAGPYQTGAQAAQGINTNLGGKDLAGSSAQFDKWIAEGRQNPDGTWKSSKMCGGQPCPDSGDHPDACPPGWQAHGIDECRPGAGAGGPGGGPGGGGPGGGRFPYPGGGGPGGGNMTATGMWGTNPNFPLSQEGMQQFQGLWGQLQGQPVQDPTGDFYRKVLGGGSNPFEAMANQQLSEQAAQAQRRLGAAGATGGQLVAGMGSINQALAGGAAQNRLSALQPGLEYLGGQTQQDKDRNLAAQQAGWNAFMGGNQFGLSQQDLALQAELGRGGLANQRYGLDINRELGLGNLDLGWEGAALNRDQFGEQRYQSDLGYGQQGMGRAQDLMNSILNSNQGINQQEQQGRGAAWGAAGQMLAGVGQRQPT